MNVMRMNQGYKNKCSIVGEEPNVDATRFFLLLIYLLKNGNKPLWDECINYSKLSIVAYMLTIKLDHRLSEVDYEKII